MFNHHLFSNFVKLICCRIVIIAWLYKSCLPCSPCQSVYSNFDNKGNLIGFLLYFHCFLKFLQVFQDFLFVSTSWSKNSLLVICALKSLINDRILIKRYPCRILLNIFEWKDKQPINVLKRSINHIIKLLFLGCVVISDLYLFQETVILNPSVKCSKNLMLSFIDSDNRDIKFGFIYLKCCPKLLLLFLLDYLQQPQLFLIFQIIHSF